MTASFNYLKGTLYKQASVAKVESRIDMSISTMRKDSEAMRGYFEVIAILPKDVVKAEAFKRPFVFFLSPIVRLIAFASLALPLLISGCATTTIETSRAALQQPLCRQNGEKLPAALYWVPQWRPDQKEPPVREALAQRGMELFVSRHTCLAITELKRLPSDAGIPADKELVQMAGNTSPGSERVVLVVVRELGPRILVGLPVLIEGGTEVVIDVRIIDPAVPKVLFDARTRWRDGGPFVIKGIKSLDKDMSAALTAALMSEPAAQ